MKNILNIASWDRIARVVLGLALLWVGFSVVGATWGVVIGIVGLILLVTGLVGFCPLYFAFKFGTLKKAVTK